MQQKLLENSHRTRRNTENSCFCGNFKPIHYTEGWL